MLKLAGQLAQVAQVDGSIDFSGFGTGCSRCPRCFWPPGGPALRITVLVSIGQYCAVLVSIDQYSSVVVSSFRIARNGRGRRKFSGYGAILTATTEPLMQACYSLSNDVVQRV